MRSSGRRGGSRGTPGGGAPRKSIFSEVALLVVVTVATVGWTLTATVPAVVDIGLATGLTGAPGSLTVLECHDSRSGRSSRQMCTGRFVYDVTGEEVAVGAFSWAEPGSVYPARITAGRDRAGFWGMKGVLGALFNFFLGLVFVTMTGMLLRLRFFRGFTLVVIFAVEFAGVAVGIVARAFL
ncbi:hypothetical protein GCM10017673_36590 [Streptosporangium violaceochromogenes]|nr:hypothetical protein GCM10017673_36590 [Streptosporangium violaceochromogenes]